MREEAGPDDATQLRRVAETVAAEAAAHLRDLPRPDARGVSTKSSPTDVVTMADTAVEQLLRDRLARLRPGEAVVGEESGGAGATSGVTWVVDPIDGTVNYLYEVPAYAVSVAVVVGDARAQGGWTPVAGAVADPSLRLVHHAGRGTGAWTRPEAAPDGGSSGAAPTRLSVSVEDRLARTLLATGFGYAPEVRARQAEVLLRVLPLVRDIRRIGSAALDLVRVADGSVDAYAESGLNAWDLAAGWLIAEEAGGVVVGEGTHPGKALTVAAGPALVEQVRTLFVAGAEPTP